MDLLTRFIYFASPSLAAKRMKNQFTAKALASEIRNYEGAGHGRRFKSWGNTSGSQNQQLMTAQPLLRDRSRDLARNFGFSKNAIRHIGNSVIGTGILGTPVSKTKNKAEVDLAKKLWKEWTEKTDCDFDGLQNFYGLQKIIVKATVKSGSCFVRRVWKKYKKGSIALEIQVLEPEFLDKTKNGETFDNGEYTVQGIQYDKYGKRKAYWIYDRHPYDVRVKSSPVPVDDIKHVFYVEDPGQLDGLPFNSSVILETKDFAEYKDAQLMKQKVSACFAGYITETDISTPTVKSGSGNSQTEHIEPGTLEHLPPGKSITFANPPTTEGFGEYSRHSLMSQAAGMGISYEGYTGDLSNVNFSSGRMGWIQEHLNVEDLQWNMAIPMVCDPVWRWFTQAAFLAGLIPDKDMGVIWTPPRREMIDPVKETEALKKQVRAGFISWQDAVRQLGYSPEEILQQLKDDAVAFDAADLMPECDPRYDAVRTNLEEPKDPEAKNQSKKSKPKVSQKKS